MKLKHVLTAAMIAWASLDVQGQQVVKHTQEELCEITKKSMIKGWKYLDNYNP